MKKNIKILALFSLLFVAMVCGNKVYAVENNSDGLIINLTTDKEEYQEKEEINADLSITNSNDYVVVITQVDNITPKGFSLDENTVNKLENKNLNIGETIHLKTKIKKIQSNVGNVDNNLPNGEIETGDNESISFWILTIAISGISIALFIGIKNKSIKKSLYILLVFSIVSSLFIKNVQAGEEVKQIIVEKNIKYNKNEVKIGNVISYKSGSSDPKEPVVYQDNVKETILDYILDEVNKEIFVQDAAKVLDWKSGEIHVLKNKTNPNDEIAIEIISSKQLPDGSVLIKYKTPKMEKVIKSIDWAGKESQNGVIIPAAGVTLEENTSTISERSNINQYSKKSREQGTLDLFKSYKFKTDSIPGMELSGKLSIERINYDFDVKAHLLGVDINKVYITLDSSVSLGLESKSDFGGEKKIELASYEAYLGYGFSAVGKIFIYLSAEGELVLEYTINNSCGFDYTDNKFKGIWELKGDLTKAKADVNVKVGCTAEPKVDFVGIGLVGAEFDYGRNYELSLDDITINPIQYCLDAGYYNYATISAIFLPGTWDKRFTTSLMDKDNSVIEEYLHIEEMGIVNECSRKYGSLEGTVLKNIGSENNPLYLAAVTLERKGDVVYSTKTGSGGVFTFGKEIEKGTYDIFVRSNGYETYKGEIKIIGNKENKIEKPIILEPYKKSVNITGNIYDLDTNVPISTATISVKGYPDRTTYSDDNGNYSLEIPLGEQTIDVSADNYSPNSYTTEFIDNLNNVNIGLKRGYKYDVQEIKAGESYAFDFKSNKRIFVRANGLTEYSSYLDNDATYHRKDYTGEFYRGVKSGEHWEIKVFSGSITVFASDGGFYDGPDSNLGAYCSISSMNGEDPFIDYTIHSGESKTFDNKIDKPKSESYVIHCISEEGVLGTQTVTDYYYNTHFGFEISENIYPLDGKQNYWRPISNLSKCKISISTGKLIVYHYRLDPLTVY